MLGTAMRAANQAAEPLCPTARRWLPTHAAASLVVAPQQAAARLVPHPASYLWMCLPSAMWWAARRLYLPPAARLKDRLLSRGSHKLALQGAQRETGAASALREPLATRVELQGRGAVTVPRHPREELPVTVITGGKARRARGESAGCSCRRS